jgi:hypothetical protein
MRLIPAPASIYLERNGREGHFPLLRILEFSFWAAGLSIIGFLALCSSQR